MFTYLTSIKAKTLLVGCLLATSALFANPTDPAKPASFNTSLYVTKANKIRLAVEKQTVEPVTISLRPIGINEPYVFSQVMRKKQAKLALQLDVSELADGIYELEIQSATGRIVRQLNLVTPAGPTQVVRTIVLPPVTDTRLSVK